MSWTPANWALWSVPPVVRGYVLVVDGLALVALAVSFQLPVPATDAWWRFLVLAAGAVVHGEAARGIERLRAVAANGVPYVNVKGMWTFAGVLALPPVLAAALVGVVYGHTALRLRRVPPHRWLFSASSVVLAGAGAALCVATLSPGTYPGVYPGWRGLVAVSLAGLVYWFVNYFLVVGAVLLSDPATSLRAAVGRPADQLIVAGSLGLGLAITVVLLYQPWSLVPVLLTVLGLHRGLLVGQFEAASRTDPGTGLLNVMAWHQLAANELTRAKRNGTTLGVVYLDLDHFKCVNDTYGHQAGDEVLKAVAAELRAELRTEDLIGRLGGEEFAALLPETTPSGAAAAADRLRARVETLTVATTVGDAITIRQLTCSIGVATYPQTADTMDELLLAADTATYTAKSTGRNRVVRAPARAR